MDSNHSPPSSSLPSDPPPPYSDISQPATSATGTVANSYPVAKPFVQECADSSQVALPKTLIAHYHLSYRNFHLGDGSNKKIFAASVYAGLTGSGVNRLCMLIHNGPSAKDKVLAAAGEPYKSDDTALTFKSLINLSPVSNQENVVKAGDLTVAMEDMSARLLEDDRTVTFPFSILTERISKADTKGKREETNGGFHLAHFEWRMTAKVEILDKNYAHEYKLFRLQPPSAIGSSVASDKAVAITSFKRLVSLTKSFKMVFVDVEAQYGPAERWRLMALITALRIWQHEQTSFYSSNAMVETTGKCV
ncbi:uncharacterized protein FTJAE_5563 [Fusarium tjaetaba]|uniref:Uncharacterized protein n=1 Tax=Fusarium tjaetaba TaxID=1567544 RepID=A0A8H5VXZ2_9HYPO|nr:uncharacterized protein FTJAE_5563 [Fusarium tjaetaba]KAF5637594.1 hypothetical protein FTJAE_5563 [Fusarium tjaetaba]